RQDARGHGGGEKQQKLAPSFRGIEDPQSRVPIRLAYQDDVSEPKSRHGGQAAEQGQQTKAPKRGKLAPVGAPAAPFGPDAGVEPPQRKVIGGAGHALRENQPNHPAHPAAAPDTHDQRHTQESPADYTQKGDQPKIAEPRQGAGLDAVEGPQK